MKHERAIVKNPKNPKLFLLDIKFTRKIHKNQTIPIPFHKKPKQKLFLCVSPKKKPRVSSIHFPPPIQDAKTLFALSFSLPFASISASEASFTSFFGPKRSLKRLICDNRSRQLDR